MQANFDQAFASIAADPAWTPSWLQDVRTRAFDHFKKHGLPSRQAEDWKYTSTRPLQDEFQAKGQAVLAERDLSSFFLPEGTALVFVNGVFDKARSRFTSEQGLRVEPLHEALPSLVSHMSAVPDGSSMESLNKALFSSGALVQVAPHAVIKAPIQLLFVTADSGTRQIIAPRNIISIGAGASASIVESHFNFLESNFTNAVTEIQVADQGRCKVLFEKVLSSQSLHVGTSQIQVGRDAEVETFVLSLGGKLNRTQLGFNLTASGASAKLDGLYVGKQNSHIDNVSEVLHSAAHTKSSQLYKGILADESRAVFNGKIRIIKDAQQVEALQLNKNLLLSENAEVDTRPQLQIDADDVRCSHGATIGQLDEDEVFYLQSRGIHRADAEHMLAKAFVGDVISRPGPFAQARLARILREFGGMDA